MTSNSLRRPAPLQVTALNFGSEPVAGSVRSDVLPPGDIVADMSTGEQIGDVDNLGAFGIALGAYQGMSLEVSPLALPGPSRPDTRPAKEG